MTLKKIQFKAGVNRENTQYASENGWYSGDKIRFRQGTPEKIGGWVRLSNAEFSGVCRALFSWTSLSGVKYIAAGTTQKYYVYSNSAYNDVTPIRTFSSATSLANPFATTTSSKVVVVTWTAHKLHTNDLVYFTGATATVVIPASELNGRHVVTVLSANTFSVTVATTPASSSTTGGGPVGVSAVLYSSTLGPNPFSTTTGSRVVTVTHVAHGGLIGDYVTFNGATAVGGLTLNAEYRLTKINSSDSYDIDAGAPASATTAGGGSAVQATYQIHVGPEINAPSSGWGAGPWSAGTWGTGSTSLTEARLWSQSNFGEDLIFNDRYHGIYYWDVSSGTVNNRAVNLNTLPDASDVPTVAHAITVSDVSRFVLAFGCNDYGSTTVDNLLIRWSDQEDAANWTPSATNQAGSIRLSHGSEIMAVMQARDEILVWTDTSLYSLQYVGAPAVWAAKLVGDNVSCPSPNGVAFAGSVMFWIGVDKFYKYDGTVQTLSCDLRQFVFGDINSDQPYLTFAGTNEGFSEIWWFYCSKASNTVDKYVTYNYLENAWCYGTMSRTAWLDSGLYSYPVAATSNGRLVYHENGVDDYEYADPKPIVAYIESAEFDIEDGDRYGFIWRVLPDVTFRGSTADSPTCTMTLLPMKNSGSGYNSPLSVGGSAESTVVRGLSVPIEQFTGQVNIRVRGRQLVLRVESSGLGVNWQLGYPRIDIKPDGRRG